MGLLLGLSYCAVPAAVLRRAEFFFKYVSRLQVWLDVCAMVTRNFLFKYRHTNSLDSSERLRQDFKT